MGDKNKAKYLQSLLEFKCLYLFPSSIKSLRELKFCYDSFTHIVRCKVKVLVESL